MWTSLPSRFAVVAALLFFPRLLTAEGRPLKVDDLFALKDVSDPRLSPDGRQVAYTVTTLDAKVDDSRTAVYLVSTDGGEPLRLHRSWRDGRACRGQPSADRPAPFQG